MKNLHVLSDFDRTITKPNVPSLISVLRDENYLTLDYPEKAKALYNKYHAIEIDSKINLDEKKKYMEEWWNLHFDLLLKSGLTKNDVEKAMESSNLELRDKAPEFLKILNEKNIPLVILSSAGLGKESIEIFLSKKNLLLPNIYIISNSFEWDKNGKAIAVKRPIIHGLNKNEIIIKNYPEIYSKIKNRKNILLLGDDLADANMAEGFGYEKITKVGFLDENIEQNLPAYKSAFDIVLANNSSMQPVIDLLENLF